MATERSRELAGRSESSEEPHLSETEVDEDARTVLLVEEEVGRLNVSMDDAAGVAGAESAEELSEVGLEKGGGEMFVVILISTHISPTFKPWRSGRRTRKSSLQ